MGRETGRDSKAADDGADRVIDLDEAMLDGIVGGFSGFSGMGTAMATPLVGTSGIAGAGPEAGPGDDPAPGDDVDDGEAHGFEAVRLPNFARHEVRWDLENRLITLPDGSTIAYSPIDRFVFKGDPLSGAAIGGAATRR